jgi:hypothetical protein
MSVFGRSSNYTPADFAPDAYRSGPEVGDSDVRPARSGPATAAEAWAALNREGPTADAVRSYLSSGAEPRYDSPQARAEAQAEREAGS